jgi:Domain of unknown function (DUF222)
MSTAPVCPLSVWQVGDAELLAELGALEARLHSTWAQMLSVVAEIDSRGMAGELGYGTTVGLVRAAARVSRGEAQDRIAADDVLPGRGVNGAPLEPKLSATAAAVAEGAIGAADVAVIRSVLSRIPEQVAVQQRAEVEAELARHARTLDGGQLAVLGKRILVALPTEGGERPQVVVTVSLPVLQGRIGSASLALGGPITADIARRIACDAEIIPVVLGSRGEPLDVGRASRTVPTAIRRAVIVRDRGCAFPGCSIPARWCDIHHVVYWAYPTISPTTLAKRPTTPQPPPHHRTGPGSNPPVIADSSAFTGGGRIAQGA